MKSSRCRVDFKQTYRCGLAALVAPLSLLPALPLVLRLLSLPPLGVCRDSGRKPERNRLSGLLLSKAMQQSKRSVVSQRLGVKDSGANDSAPVVSPPSRGAQRLHSDEIAERQERTSGMRSDAYPVASQAQHHGNQADSDSAGDDGDGEVTQGKPRQSVVSRLGMTARDPISQSIKSRLGVRKDPATNRAGIAEKQRARPTAAALANLKAHLAKRVVKEKQAGQSLDLTHAPYVSHGLNK